MTFYHLLALFITTMLFIITYRLTTKKPKQAIVMQQLLRLSYLFVLSTGIMLLPMEPVSLGRLAKLLFGLLTIGAFEIILMHKRMGDLTKVNWIVFTIIAGITVVLGLFLPTGIALFNG